MEQHGNGGIQAAGHNGPDDGVASAEVAVTRLDGVTAEQNGFLGEERSITDQGQAWLCVSNEILLANTLDYGLCAALAVGNLRAIQDFLDVGGAAE
jgi:hypothetical protein